MLIHSHDDLWDRTKAPEAKVAELERKIADIYEDFAIKTALAADLRAKVAEQSATIADISQRWLSDACTKAEIISAQAATIERLTSELAEYRPHCGHTILSDNLGRVYGCGKPQGHEGPHETVEERRAALSKQEPK